MTSGVLLRVVVVIAAGFAAAAAEVEGVAGVCVVVLIPGVLNRYSCENNCWAGKAGVVTVDWLTFPDIFLIFFLPGCIHTKGIEYNMIN